MSEYDGFDTIDMYNFVEEVAARMPAYGPARPHAECDDLDQSYDD